MESLRIFLILVAIGASNVHAITITPANPVPRDTLVRIKYESGQGITVLRSDFSAVDFLDCGGGSAAFVGPPGRYAVFASSEGKMSVTVVEIGPGQPVPPGPDPVPPGPDPEPLSPTAIAVRDEVRKLSVQDRALAVPQAQVWESSASQVAAGIAQETVWLQTRAALRALFVDSDQGRRWNPANARINAVLIEQRDRDPSSASIAQMLREIARGLRAGMQ